jgi:H+/gluconate symporter-like permease
MKILIWIGCFLCFAILRVGYIHSGILLGAIPRSLLAMLGFWITWLIAKKLCDKWEQRQKDKEDEKTSISNEEEIDDKPLIFTKKIILPIVLSVLLIISLIGNIVQATDINDYKDIVAEQHKTIDEKADIISALIADGVDN